MIHCLRFEVTNASIDHPLLRVQSNETRDGETLACNESPGRVFMGVLPTLFHEVSGQLFVKDNKTIIIRDFNYDGLGPGQLPACYIPGYIYNHILFFFKLYIVKVCIDELYPYRCICLLVPCGSGG